jgi:hypothetical protein
MWLDFGSAIIGLLAAVFFILGIFTGRWTMTKENVKSRLLLDMQEEIKKMHEDVKKHCRKVPEN